MKQSFWTIIVVLQLLISAQVWAQCGFDTGEGCVGTDYSNAFSTSTTNRNTIEYDNFVSSFHSTIVRTSTGGFKVWGEFMNNDGVSHALSPLDINSTNYPALTGTPLKATLGSNFFQNVQGIVLTTTGLFAWGTEAAVLANAITSNTTFQKLTINGQADGLPVGVDPIDVKMITASANSLALVTCSGSVYVLSQLAEIRGVGGGGTTTAWSQVTTSGSGNPVLSGIVACRISFNVAYALGSDGSIWTWGAATYLGNGTPMASRNRATQMTLPTFNAGQSAKMISITTIAGNNPSYYILSTDNNLYAVGENSNRQLGDLSTTDRTSWVQPRYTSTPGDVMDDIKWIAANENDSGANSFAAINVLTTGAQVYNFGQNALSMLGRGTDPADPGKPSGIASTDEMIALETGGHTSLYVKKCELNFGYVGHRIHGSMGNGSAASATEASVTYATATVAICAADAIPKITLSITPSGTGGSYCTTQTATVSASPPGGTLSVFSGPATLVGNTLSFSGAGQVILAYTISPPCGGVSDVKDTLDVIVCVSAVKETGTVYSYTGGTAIANVVSNDLINGSPATLGGAGNATIAQSGSWPSGISLNTTTGEITVTPGTPAGTYQVPYQICDKLSPPNCLIVLDTVFVLPSILSLNIAKTQTGGPNPVTAAGQIINYQIVVTNTGNTTLTGVNVTDVLPSGSAGTPSGPVESISTNGQLNVGETWTYTINYTVTQANIDAGGSIVNTASVTTTEVPGPTTTTATTPVTQSPSLTILKTKTSGPSPVTAAGQVLGYTIVLTNTGNQTLTGVNTTDLLPNGSAGTLSSPTESISNNGQLNVGETWTYTINYTVTQANIDAGSNLVNTATVTTTQTPTPQNSTATTPVTQSPSLTILKTKTSGPSPVTAAGQVLGYTIVLTNTGNQTLTGVNTTDLLPNGSAGTLSSPTESISNNGQLNVGETWTYTINYTVTQANIDAGSNLVNTATVTTTQTPTPQNSSATTPVTQSPSLTITKDQTSGQNPVTAAGQMIGYTIVVTNTGNQTLTGININDQLPNGNTGILTGPSENISSNGQLNVGEIWTYTASYITSQDDIDTGDPLVNLVTIQTNEIPTPLSDDASTDVTQSPSLTITKDQINGPNPITAAGQTIGYQIIVTNTGNQTQTGINVSDVLPGGAAGTLSGPTESISSNGQLDVAETWTYTISYTATQADINAGVNLVNTASVTTTQVPGPTTDTATTPVTQSPSLTIVKDQISGPNPITAAGQTIGYQIVVTNTGNQTQTGINVSDVLPGGAAGALSGPTESISSNGQLDVAETWTYTISYTATQSDIDAGVNLVNTASVTTTQVPGPTTDTATTPVTQTPSLTIVKDQISGPNPITAAGQTIGYQIVVTNTGNQTQTGINVSDVLPGGAAGALSGPTESISSNGQLDVAETWTYTISYTATQSDIDAGVNLVNTASVTTTQVPGPTTDTATTPVTQTPSLTIVKDQISGPNPITAAGQTIGYQIVVTNTGNQTQTGINVSDVLPGGASGTLSGPTESISSNGQLDVAETWTYTISYTATQADINAGVNLVNTASVTTTQVPGPTTDTATTPVTQTPSLTIVKDQISGPNPITAAGQTIGYQIIVTNTGNQTQTGINVSDVLPGGASGTLSGPTESISSNGQLDVAETWTYTISYTATQADIDAGVNLVNTASVTTTQVPGPTTDTATTPVTQTPSLTIVKDQISGPNPITAAGQTIGYQIVVTNTGNQTQTGINVSDVLPGGAAGTLSGPTESISSNGQLDIAETWTYTISYTATQSDIDAGVNLVNTASVTTTQVPGPTTDTATTPVTQTPSLTIVKDQISGPNPITAAGQTIGYQIIVTNTGNQTQTGINVSDVLPGGASGTLSGPTESISSNGQLDVAETWTYTISYTATQSDIDAGVNLVNTASVTTTQVPGPTTDTATTPVTQTPSLTIVKDQISGPNPITAAGQTIGYQIVVTNTGNQTQTGINVSDVLPGGAAGALSGPTESISSNGQLDVAETWTYTISYTATQSDIDAGVNLVNTASVTTTQVPGPTTDTATTPVTQTPSLTIVKDQISGPNPITAAGQTIGYQIVVTNTGNQTQTGINVSDVLPGGASGTLSGPTESISSNGQLDVAETWTYTISYTATQADINAGVNLVNTASVTTTQVPGPTTDTATTPVTQTPSLTIVKDQISGPNPITAAGQTIGYQIIVTNTGNQTQTGINVSDVLPGGASGTLSGPTESISSNGQLDVAETWTYTISYTATQADIDAGVNLVNTASVTTTQVPGPTTDTATTPVTQTPSLTIVKDQISGPNPITAAGQTIGYQIVVTNTGNQTQTGINVSDVLPGGAAGTLSGPTESISSNGQLDIAETWTYTISYTATQSDIDAGVNLVNTASVTTTQVPGPTSDTATTPVTQTPSLTIVKDQISGPNPITAAGQTIGYQIVVTNTGNQTQTGINVSDVLPGGASGTLSGPTESISSNGQLDIAETWTYTISYTATQSDIDAGVNLVNTASVTTTQVPGPTTDTATTPVTQSPSLTITKDQTSGPNPITAAGQTIGYQIVVTNTGNQTQTGINVSDVLPGGASGTLSGPTESISSNGQLDIAETWTYTISYTATQADVDAGVNLVNTASVTTTQVPGPTTDTATTPVTQTPSLTIVKDQISGPNPITAAGQTIGYQIVVTNTGNQTQTGINVSDVLPGGASGTLSGPTESISSNGQLDIAETWTYTISYTATQADIDAGVNLVNTASVTTTQVPGPTTDTATTPVTQSPSLTIVKDQISGPNPITAAGQTIGYQIVVTNTGNQTQTGINVSDVLPSGASGTLSGPTESISSNGQLDIAETWTYTISYTATQADIDAGVNLVNTASVTTTQVPGPTTDTATTPVTQIPSLTIVKDQISGPNPITAVGQTIGYQIVVTNTGNQTQTGINVSDVLPGGAAGTLSGPTESISSNGQLDVAETWTYTISYTATQSDIDAGVNLVNTASVTTTQVPGPTTDTASTPVSQNPAISILKSQTGGPNPATLAGQVINYSIIVTNTGNQTLTNVNVTDQLPDGSIGSLGLPIESISNNGQLNVGEMWTYAINYTTTQSDIDNGSNLVNTATVTTQQLPNPVSDNAVTTVSQMPSLIIVKTQTGGPNPITAAGQTINYSVLVTNTGTQTLTNVVVTDVLPNGTNGILAGPVESLIANGQIEVGEIWTYTINYTVTQGEIDAGLDLINTAYVTTTQVPGPTSDIATTPIVQSPSLTIVKDQTSGPNPITAAGQTIGYQIIVTNTGNQTQTGINVSDVLPGGAAGTLSSLTESISSNGQLEVAETWTYTISYTATQSDIDAGVNLVNIASVTTTQVPGPTTDTATTPVTQTPSLTITKDQISGPNPITAAGQTIGYQIVVTNTGNQTQTGINVSDVLPGGAAGTLSSPTESISSNGQLDVAETWTYTISYTATQSDIDAGVNLVNIASVTTTQVPGPTTDTATTPVTQTPSLTITKDQISGPNPITAAGQTIGYQIVVTNTGNQTQTGINVSDVLPGGAAGILSGPTESISSNGQLDVAETWTYTISYTATQADINAGVNLVNTASVTTTQVPGPTTDTATTPVTQSPSLTITKDQTSGPNPITAAGQTIGYQIVVTNTGNQTQTGINVSDVLPGGAAGTLSSPTESISSNGQLDVAETWTYTISYTATQSDIDAGVNLVNTASVTTTQVPGPTTDTATTPVTQSPSLTITKDQTSGPNPITAAGQTIGYQIVVTNTGNQTQTGINVSDVLPGGAAGTLSGPTESISSNGQLDVAETWTYTISYTATQSDIDAGVNLVNTASVTTTQVPGPTTDTASTPVTQSPSLTITKDQTGGPNPITAAGQTINYTIVVTNTGNQTHTGINVSDVLPGGASGTLGSPTESISNNGQLDIAETWTYTINYTATQADVNAAVPLVNNAIVTTNEAPDPKTDSASTPVVSSPSIHLEKTGSISDLAPVGINAGDEIDYVFAVTNTGNVDLYNVTISDFWATISGGPIDTLKVGETNSIAISGVYTISQYDIDLGAFTNLATATGTPDVGPNVTDDDTDDQVFLQSPDIQLTKTGELIDVSPAGHNPGDYISYKFKVKNTGNVTLSTITISDPQAVVSGGPIITLIPGEEDSLTFTGVHILTQSDIDNGSFNNIATVSGLAPDNSTIEDADDDTQMFIQSPALAITKDQVGGPSPVNEAGQSIDYAIVVENTGNITLHNVAINDQLPNGNAGVLAGPVEDITSDGNLEVGETWTYTISYIVTQNDIDLGDPLVNTATVSTDELPIPQTDDAITPVDQLPSMSVVKTQVGGPNPVTTAGQTIDYTITIENTGNLTLTGIVPVDVLPNGMIGTLAGPTESISSNGQLDVAETWTYTISYTVSQNDIDAGVPLVNHASVKTNELPDPETDDETTPVSQAPMFTVVKTQTSLPDTITMAGQVISYQIVVTNTGNVSLNNVVPVDIMPDGSTGSLSGPFESLNTDGILQTGEAWTYTTSYTVTQNDINNGEDLINSVSVDTDETPDPVTDEENTPIKQLPGIQLLKTGTYADLAPAGYNAGDEIHYTFEIQNTGNVTLYNVYITDYLVNVLGGPIPIMNPGDIDNTTISAIYIIQQSDINNGSFSNQAFAYGTPPSGPEVSDDDTDDQTFIQTPSIQLVKKGAFVDLAPTGYNAGDQIEYKFYVTNTGNVTLNNIEVSDPLVMVNGGTLSSLSPGETDSITFSAVYTITQLALDTAAVTNTAFVVGYAPDNSPVEDSDTYTEVLVQAPMFTVTKTQTGGPNPVSLAGSIINYTIEVVNTGNITLTNINVVDIMPDGSNAPVGMATESMTANGLLEVGETWSYSVSYSVSQTDIDNGTPLVNHVSVTTDETPDPETDEETTPIGQLPAFTVTKTQVSGANPVTTVGQVIGYQIEVANTGNVSLNNIVITDVMPDGSIGILSAPSESALNNGVLEVGETWTYTTSYTVSQADIDNGSPLVNHVSVTTDETPDPKTDEETTPVQQNPGYTVSKTQTSGPNPVTSAGDIIGYTITLVNTGNVSLNNIVINDEMPDGSTGALGIPTESVVTDGVLNVTEAWTYTIQYTVTQSDVDAGLPLVNRVTVTTDEDPDPKMDEEITPISQQPSLWSDKSSSLDLGVNAISNPGDIITYTYHVTNNGKVTLNNVSINESAGQFTGGGILPVPVYQSSSMGSPQGTLLVGETATYVANYIITFADIIQGKVENKALAQGDSPLGLTVTDDSDSGNVADPNDTDTPSDPQGSDPTTTLIPPPPPVAVNDVDLDNMPGTAVVVDILNNDHLYNGSTPLPSLVTVTLIDPATGMPTLMPNTVVIPGQGTYVYNPTSGEITFTPVSGYTSDPDAINYILTENGTGLSDTANILVTYLEAAPFANDDSSLGNAVGTNATVNLLTNDQLSDGSQATTANTSVVLIDPATGMPTLTPNVVTIAGQGVYTYNPATGDLTFDPLDGFTTDPTPIGYILTETLTGLTDDALVTITYIEQPPVANDDNSLGNSVGSNATVNLLTNDHLSDGSQATTANTSIVLIDPATGMPTLTPNVVTIPGQGVYTYNPATGILTFDPMDGFTTDPAPINYILTETLTGLTDNALVIVTYNEEPPVANDDSSLGNTVGNNATVNLLTNDHLSDGSQATTTNTSVVLIDPATGMPTVTPNVVTIPGQGVYTYNPATGILTFDPMDGFTTDPAPINYILTETLTGLTDNALVTITYNEEPPVANDDSSLGNTVGNNVIVNLLTNDQLADGSQATTANTSVVLIDPATGMPTLTPNVVTIAGQGVYTYNPATGELTFDPDNGFTSDPMPIFYILTEILTGLTDPAHVTIDYYQVPPVANDDSSLGNTVGTNATVNLLVNDHLADGSQATTTNTSVVLIDPATAMPSVIPNVVTIPGQGVYTYNPATGDLTFDPFDGFTTDPSPINYTLTELATGLTDNALVTVTYNEQPPVAIDDNSLGNTVGTNATVNLLTNDQLSDGSQATISNTTVVLIDPATGMPTLTPNVVTIPGQGVYTYNPATGNLTFDPFDGFTTDPSPIDYTLTEIQTGLSDNATVTITYIEMPPFAVDDFSNGNVPGNNAVVNILSNDDVSDGSPATTTNTTVVLIDPATGVPTATPNVVTISGQGTYTYNPANGDLTFDPFDGFTTDPDPIDYVLTEIMTGLTDQATVTITYNEVPPIANDDTSNGNVIGANAVVNILANDQLSDGSPATVANTSVVLIDPSTGMPTLTPNVIDIPGVGIYTYNPATGVLLFDPAPGFTADPTPINYLLTEIQTGLTDEALVTINYDEMPPIANDDNSFGNVVGTNASLNLLTNDMLSDGSQATPVNSTLELIDPATGMPTLTLNVVTIAGQGVYTYNPATGVLTFDPNPGFTTDPTPINYILTETLTGLSDQAQVTITYNEIPPVANDDQSTGNIPGNNATLNLLTNDDVSDGTQATTSNTSITLIDPATGLPTVTPNVVTIAGQGVYTYNPATGVLTFDPNPGFTTDPTPINYILTETLTGLSDQAHVTIAYNEIPPVANDDQSLGNVPGNNATVNILTNDDLSDGSQATVSNTSVTLIDPATGLATTTPNVVTIAGQGVYTYNPATGVLTFDPNPGFTTDPTPISYLLTEVLTGLTDPAVVTMTYAEQPPVANDDSSLGNVVGTNATVNLLTNDHLSDGSPATTGNTTVTLIDPATGLPTVTPNVVTIPGQGVYTYNPATGVLTFDPNVGFTTDPTPISYTLTEVLTGLKDNAKVTVTYNEIPPIANDDSSLDNQTGVAVTLNILANDDLSDGSQATTANTSVVLINPATGLPTVTPNTVTIPGQGVYTYNPANGVLTFTPNVGYTGDPTPLPYRLTETQTGLSDMATATITYLDFVQSIGSLVWEDLNGDGIYQTNEPGVPNVQVELFDPSGNLIAVTFTDNTGHFLFTNILAGTYYFTFTPDPSYGFTFPNVGSNNNVDSDVDGAYGPGTTGLITFNAGQVDLTWNAGLYQCVEIGEKVWYDVDKDDILDQSENGINGLKVNLWRVVGSTKSIYESKYTGHKPGTGSTDGYFKFCAPPGTYYIEVVMPPIGLVQARANIGNDDNIDSDLTNANGKSTTSNFTVLSGQSKTDIGAGFYPMATAGNLVWIDDNSDGVQQAEEPRVANVLVEAFDTLNQKVAEDYTDQNGTYKIEYLGKSSYYLKFNPPAGYGYTAPNLQDDAINSDVDHSNGLNTTRYFAMNPGVNYVNIDAGLAFGALPVRWLDVKAENKGDHNVIFWSTASEVNTDKFIVQRRHESEDEFFNIAEVRAAGLSTNVSTYNATDADIEKGGVYYYRIQQWDLDGHNSLSKTVAVRLEVKHNVVGLYPNPARDYSTLSLDLKGQEDAVVSIYDAEGRLVQIHHLKSESRFGLSRKLRISGLSTGVYMVQTTQGSYTDIRKLIMTE